MGDLLGWVAIIVTLILLYEYVPWWLVLAVAAIIGIVYFVFPAKREIIFTITGSSIVMFGLMAICYMLVKFYWEIFPS